MYRNLWLYKEFEWIQKCSQIFWWVILCAKEREACDLGSEKLDRGKAQLGGMGLRGNLQSLLKARDSDRGSSQSGNRRKSRRQTSRWELFLKRSSKKVVGGEFYRQGSPGTTGWKMVQKSYGEKCLSRLWSWTIILGREKFFEIIGKGISEVSPTYLPLSMPQRSLPGGSDGKESTCSAGDLGSIPGLGRSPGERNGCRLLYSCLENSMDRGAWWATVWEGANSQTRLSN